MDGVIRSHYVIRLPEGHRNRTLQTIVALSFPFIRRSPISATNKRASKAVLAPLRPKSARIWASGRGLGAGGWEAKPVRSTSPSLGGSRLRQLWLLLAGQVAEADSLSDEEDEDDQERSGGSIPHPHPLSLPGLALPPRMPDPRVEEDRRSALRPRGWGWGWGDTPVFFPFRSVAGEASGDVAPAQLLLEPTRVVKSEMPRMGMGGPNWIGPEQKKT
ncbi:hypothetical protein AXG93_2752s2070 [Marchantia polymorpha subsp. ruderalis]|uniref:Uncharacterized protein n=1 Tax=Marchantia polymorpha subsp. ruderalis TaxID=1480154 RepID=A0A176VTQ3_MARPO|nr:hypothetical protein AXG93_2752s2070 [Marchantia polymorpha subsp. ruderalis]